MSKQQPEYNLQTQIVQYLELQYKDVLFLSDTVAFLKLTIPQQMRNKKIQKSGFKCPDILILEPKGKYAGLFIELKVKDIFKKHTNQLLSNAHVEAQAECIEKLKEKGYYACFGIGFEQTKKIIDNYINETL